MITKILFPKKFSDKEKNIGSKNLSKLFTLTNNILHMAVYKDIINLFIIENNSERIEKFKTEKLHDIL